MGGSRFWEDTRDCEVSFDISFVYTCCLLCVLQSFVCNLGVGMIARTTASSILVHYPHHHHHHRRRERKLLKSPVAPIPYFRVCFCFALKKNPVPRPRAMQENRNAATGSCPQERNTEEKGSDQRDRFRFRRSNNRSGDLGHRLDGRRSRQRSSSLTTAERLRGLGQWRVACVLVQVLLWRCAGLGDLLLCGFSKKVRQASIEKFRKNGKY